MNFFLYLLLTVAGVSAMTVDLLQNEWNTFKLKHGKHYDPVEDGNRMQIFLKNRLVIEEHNQRYLNGETSYFMRTNKFSDYYDSEINKYLFGFNMTDFLLYAKRGETFREPGYPVEESIDWVAEGAVTEVKNQDTCACCWAFAATGALEGQMFMNGNIAVPLSEQNLVDCASRGDGCTRSSNMLAAFYYVAENQGIDTEDTYPYIGKKQQCNFKDGAVGIKTAGYITIMNGNEMTLKTAVATQGPIAVGFNAPSTLVNYGGGIYEGDDCNSYDLDHAMLVVGYGSEDGKDYWLLKNSWGKTWGDMGYLKLIRNMGNRCGIATAASYPVIKL